jgi:hypothetical protein
MNYDSKISLPNSTLNTEGGILTADVLEDYEYDSYVALLLSRKAILKDVEIQRDEEKTEPTIESFDRDPTSVSSISKYDGSMHIVSAAGKMESLKVFMKYVVDGKSSDPFIVGILKSVPEFCKLIDQQEITIGLYTLSYNGQIVIVKSSRNKSVYTITTIKSIFLLLWGKGFRCVSTENGVIWISANKSDQLNEVQEATFKMGHYNNYPKISQKGVFIEDKDMVEIVLTSDKERGGCGRYGENLFKHRAVVNLCLHVEGIDEEEEKCSQYVIILLPQFSYNWMQLWRYNEETNSIERYSFGTMENLRLFIHILYETLEPNKHLVDFEIKDIESSKVVHITSGKSRKESSSSSDVVQWPVGQLIPSYAKNLVEQMIYADAACGLFAELQEELDWELMIHGVPQIIKKFKEQQQQQQYNLSSQSGPIKINNLKIRSNGYIGDVVQYKTSYGVIFYFSSWYQLALAIENENFKCVELDSKIATGAIGIHGLFIEFNDSLYHSMVSLSKNRAEYNTKDMLSLFPKLPNSAISDIQFRDFFSTLPKSNPLFTLSNNNVNVAFLGDATHLVIHRNEGINLYVTREDMSKWYLVKDLSCILKDKDYEWTQDITPSDLPPVEDFIEYVEAGGYSTDLKDKNPITKHQLTYLIDESNSVSTDRTSYELKQIIEQGLINDKNHRFKINYCLELKTAPSKLDDSPRIEGVGRIVYNDETKRREVIFKNNESGEYTNYMLHKFDRKVPINLTKLSISTREDTMGMPDGFKVVEIGRALEKNQMYSKTNKIFQLRMWYVSFVFDDDDDEETNDEQDRYITGKIQIYQIFDQKTHGLVFKSNLDLILDAYSYGALIPNYKLYYIPEIGMIAYNQFSQILYPLSIMDMNNLINNRMAYCDIQSVDSGRQPSSLTGVVKIQNLVNHTPLAIAETQGNVSQVRESSGSTAYPGSILTKLKGHSNILRFIMENVGVVHKESGIMLENGLFKKSGEVISLLDVIKSDKN